MRRRTNKFSPNRKIVEIPPSSEAREQLAARLRYGGNPEHKRNPGDFGLVPPSQPRLGKTLCDEAGIFARQQALRLLQEGARRGIFSAQVGAGGNFPQMIWAVTEADLPMEARIENPELGIYHGYPMPVHDPFRTEVLRLWRLRSPQVEAIYRIEGEGL